MKSPDDVMDMYVPGDWTCPKCNFSLSKQTIFVNSGEVGCSRDDVMRMEGEFCPNDGEPMRRTTWRERAEDNRKWGMSLMEEIIAATGAEHLPGALAAIKATFKTGPDWDGHQWRTTTDKNKCDICGDGPWGRHRFQPAPLVAETEET